MEVRLKQYVPTAVKLKYVKVGLTILLVLCGVAEVCQSAPIPARRDRWNPWNPYYYPKARSLSLPTPRPTTTTTTTTTTNYPIRITTPPRRPPIIRSTQLPAGI